MRFLIPYLILATFYVLDFAKAGFLTDKLYSGIPGNCKETCSIWSNSTAQCVENIQQLTFSMSPSLGTFTIENDNKLLLFLCVCNDNTKQSALPCLSCLSTFNCLNEPITLENYEAVCRGEQDGFLLIEKSTTSLCMA